MDSYFWSIYKQVRPSVEQQAAMTEIWTQWERRKRKLDDDMHAARALLEALPAHVPLPREFLAHLNALVATRLLTSSAPASTVADTQNQAARQRPPHAPPTPPFPEFCTSSTADKSALIYHLESCFCDSSSSHSNHAQMHSSGSSGCVTNGSVNKAPSSGGLSAGLAAKHDRMESRVRFLGQCPRAMEAADGALEALQGVQVGDRGLFVDALASQMPGVVLEAEQTMKMWADHFVSKATPPDYMELYQMAAVQQNRCKLFGVGVHFR